jgi:hypothetical protein
MKKLLMLVALEITGAALTGFCFTAGALAMRKVSEKTGIFKTASGEK